MLWLRRWRQRDDQHLVKPAETQSRNCAKWLVRLKSATPVTNIGYIPRFPRHIHGSGPGGGEVLAGAG
jgi:hypothetical protein